MAIKGRIMVIGGHEDRSDNDIEIKEKNRDYSPDEILRTLIPESMEETYRDSFRQLDFDNFGFLHAIEKKDGNVRQYLQRIKDAKTVFFTGGDQGDLCERLKGTDTVALLQEKCREDGDFVLAGTSAGAMCMTRIMIDESAKNEALISGELQLTEGLGFLDHCIVDTHFVDHGRFGRLAHAVALHRELWGLGIGEDTALIIEGVTQTRCIGSGMVTAITAAHLGCTNIDTTENGTPIFMENLTVHLLTAGCSINLETGELQLNER